MNANIQLALPPSADEMLNTMLHSPSLRAYPSQKPTQYEEGRRKRVAVLAQQHKRVLAGGLAVRHLAEVAAQELRQPPVLGGAVQALRLRGG